MFSTYLLLLFTVLSEIYSSQDYQKRMEFRERHGDVRRNLFLNLGMQDLKYACGVTHLPYDIPIGWLARDGSNGKSNETLYRRVYKTVPVCCPGYTRNHEDICVPACKGGCLDGWCLRPNVCVCEKGYNMNNLGHCVSCNCQNGSCQDGMCVCNEGFSLDMETLTCKAICNFTCENGECTAPGQCSCLDGYKVSALSNNICVPHCSTECIHGRCIAPDICSCFRGYYRNNELDVCIPVCAGCDNGVCLHPGICMCQKGFKRQNDTCVPTCEGRCANGVCRGEYCDCYPGYEKYEQYVCMPTCTPLCVHSWCIAPNFCQCEDGYIKTSEPHRCTLPDTNG